jgi:hypothetical protein
MLKKGSIPPLDLRTALSHPPGNSGPPKTIEHATASPVFVSASPARPLHNIAVENFVPLMEPDASVLSPATSFAMSLKQWQEIDATDFEGIWFQAVVILRDDHHIRVHFVGWDKIWCENIPIEELHCRIRNRRHHSETGPGGPQTIKAVMALYRCGCVAGRDSSVTFIRDDVSGIQRI